MLRQNALLIQRHSTIGKAFQNYKWFCVREKTNDSLSDRLRRGVEALKENASKASKDATSPENVNKAKSLIREKSQKFYDASKPLASSLIDKAKKVSNESLSVGMNATSTIAAKTGQAARKGIDSAVDSAKRNALKASSSAKGSTKLVLEAASKTATSKAQATTEAVKKPLTRIRDRFDGRKIVRWMWWWSLAAIGVYGMSTTVSKELIRQAFRSNEHERKD